MKRASKHVTKGRLDPPFRAVDNLPKVID